LRLQRGPYRTVQKRAGAELDRGLRVHVISEYVEREIERFRKLSGEQPVAQASTALLDACFRKILATAWS
jgi:hypothetical protein